MKNLSEFKKNIKLGAKIHTIYHMMSSGCRDEKGNIVYIDEDKGIREVSIVQTNSFALKTIKQDGTFVDSWCHYPKASETIMNKNDSITIMEEQRDKQLLPVLTYKFVE